MLTWGTSNIYSAVACDAWLLKGHIDTPCRAVCPIFVLYTMCLLTVQEHPNQHIRLILN